MRWLVTGGLGVVGSLFARKMLERGDDVRIIDSAEEPRNGWIARAFASEKIHRYRIEIMPAKLLQAAVQDADAVLHAAASTGIPYSVTAPGDDWERNVEGTRALLDALRLHPRPTVVLSSVKPYRVTAETEARGLNESDVLEPDECYAASKAAQSHLVTAYAHSYGLPLTTLRCSNLAGPAPCHGPRHGWVTWFCISAALGRPIRIEGAGTQNRDVLHASDVASAVLAALKIEQTGDLFNIGGGPTNRISVNACAKMLQELTGVPIVNAPGRVMDDHAVWADHSKFTAATGWVPQVSVIDTVKDILAWAMRNKGDLAKIYEGV